MNLVFGHADTVNAWLAKRYGVHVAQAPADIIGVIDANGVLCGAFVLTWRNDSTTELHLYGRTSNDTWKAFFAYAFAAAYRLEIMTDRRNKAIKRAAPKFGFRFEGVSKDYYGPGRDGLRFYLTPNLCRWIKTNGKPVQEPESASAY